MSLWQECVRAHAHTLTCIHHTHTGWSHESSMDLWCQASLPSKCKGKEGLPASDWSRAHFKPYAMIFSNKKLRFIKIPIMGLGRWIHKCLPQKHGKLSLTHKSHGMVHVFDCHVVDRIVWHPQHKRQCVSKQDRAQWQRLKGVLWPSCNLHTHTHTRARARTHIHTHIHVDHCHQHSHCWCHIVITVYCQNLFIILNHNSVFINH